MTFLPCPHCGDDTTFADRPAGARRCAVCAQLCAVVRVDTKNEVVATRRRRRGRPALSADELARLSR